MLEVDPRDNEQMRYKVEPLKNDDGEVIGWQLFEMCEGRASAIFTFNKSGILTHYTCPEPGYSTELRFDENGEMIEWYEWTRHNDDGVGVCLEKTVYDKYGRTIDTEWD